MLHVTVGRVRKSFLLLARRIETNEVAGDVFYFILGALLESFPLTAAKSGDRRF